MNDPLVMHLASVDGGLGSESYYPILSNVFTDYGKCVICTFPLVRKDVFSIECGHTSVLYATNPGLAPEVPPNKAQQKRSGCR